MKAINKSNLTTATLKLIEEINKTATPYRYDASIHQLFEEQVKKSPDATALVFGETQHSYSELNAKANQLAHYLKDDIEPGDVVGFNVPRHPDMVISMLAILKLNGVYLPLDSDIPSDRMAYMLKKAQCRVIINKKPRHEYPSDQKVVELTALSDELSSQDQQNPELTKLEGALAYINFTSGTTGQPKGVLISHQGVLRLVSNVKYIELSEQTSILQMAPVTFDAATFEIWGALLNGGRTVLFDRAMPTIRSMGIAIEKHQVNLLFITTALFNAVIDERPVIFSPLKQLLTGGESHSVRHMTNALASLPNTRIYNVYGPTESTTFATLYPVNHIGKDWTRIPIGKPIDNTRVYVLDELLNHVNIGDEGFLYLGGDGLAQGYLDDEKITQDKFMENIVTTLGSERLYVTGDRVRLLESGDIDFIGRDDNQVKIKGFRIELDEIESVLKLYDLVKGVFVTTKAKDSGIDKIVAFIHVHKQIEIGHLKQFVKTKLPHYMLPSDYIVVPNMILNKNGKIDKKELLSISEFAEL